MTRKEFVRMCGLLGLGIPLHSTLSSCSGGESQIEKFSGKVIIIGAGPAGLTAGYLLRQRGLDFSIVEAAPVHGGRIKRTLDFADFPISLGGEWLHVEKDVLGEIVNDPSVQIDIDTTPYNHEVDYGLYEGQEISTEDIGFTIDQKFIASSWFDFFETYVVPSVREQIQYNKIVQEIDYSGDKIVVRTDNESFSADRVIVTVPVKILQNGHINFSPALPDDKIEAINEVTVWDGCKAFIQFREKFYPTFVGYEITPESAGQKLYYDAAYGQNSNQNILGLFAVGTGTLPYVQLSDSELIDYMLSELDEVFDGQASANYIKHLFQNWNAEPFANGAYLTDQENWRTVRTLGQSVADKLYFAGDGYTTGADWSSVHAAARSAIRAVEELTA